MLNFLEQFTKCLEESKATSSNTDPKNWWEARTHIDESLKVQIHFNNFAAFNTSIFFLLESAYNYGKCLVGIS